VLNAGDDDEPLPDPVMNYASGWRENPTGKRQPAKAPVVNRSDGFDDEPLASVPMHY